MQLVDEHGITGTALAPTMLNFLLQHPKIHDYDLSTLRSIGYGAAAMPVEVLRPPSIASVPIVYSGFGMTELGGNVLTFPKAAHVRAIKGEEHLLASCGTPMCLANVKVVDDDMAECPPGVVGEIVIQAEQVLKGYFRNEEGTKAAFEGGWFHTGDMARRDEEGFFYIVDRMKDMILTGGENVYSREVEEVIYAHPAVSEAAVIGLPDPTWGESVTAVVVLREGMSATEEEIIAVSRDRLAGFKKPKQGPLHRRAAEERERQDPQARPARSVRLRLTDRPDRPPPPGRQGRRRHGRVLWPRRALRRDARLRRRRRRGHGPLRRQARGHEAPWSRRRGPPVRRVPVDVTVYEDCDSGSSSRRWPRSAASTCLVNNAGWADDRLIRTEHCRARGVREDGEDRPRRPLLHDAGLRPHMLRGGGGSIINLSSIFGMAGSENRTAGYFAAKGGVNQLTKLLACEWGDRNLRVNALAPNFFISEMTRRLLEDSGMADWMRSRTPMRRLGELDELVGPFLSSPPMLPASSPAPSSPSTEGGARAAATPSCPSRGTSGPAS